VIARSKAGRMRQARQIRESRQCICATQGIPDAPGKSGQMSDASKADARCKARQMRHGRQGSCAMLVKADAQCKASLAHLHYLA
jgi:hypothetical protein